jgi:hypothetical protein
MPSRFSQNLCRNWTISHENIAASAAAAQTSAVFLSEHVKQRMQQVCCHELVSFLPQLADSTSCAFIVGRSAEFARAT